MKTILFDFDGTLADTLPLCYYAFQCVFKEYDNKELTSEEIKVMFGPSETEIIRQNLTNGEQEQAIELYYSKYLEKHSQLVKQNQKIYDLLRFLRDKEFKLGIVTGKAQRSLDISLERLKMKEFFDVIITGDDVHKPKPDPEGIIKALNLLDIQCEDAVVVGDSDADIAAGLQANIYTVGVQWMTSQQNLEFTVEPHRILKNISDFSDFIKQKV
ncbi:MULTISPECIES: HAD family hydrolase [Bacillus cereus group]|uniref:HAD family hydrolase n=1 Tax=Bacillus bombysepticus str. Wang TaxID=1330043 RepID=A0A9W3PTV2_9BACI|nr:MULTISPECIES: HAD family hydrolase [Bacillus cereus group]AHX21656.1 HAD family hydrolase [Bacillus bombysepticus str. Wang]MCE9758247.1 HAD family hydrolase [Bacillus cereus]HDR7992361.1 HAD family hydrolase [Bacillus cereus]